MLTTLLKHYFLTKWRSFKSREELEAWQNRKVMKHIQWVKNHSPFYQTYYRGLNLSDWRNFPTIDKKEMMEHFSALNTCSISREEAFSIALQAEDRRIEESVINGVAIGLSTGTSGNRGLFLVNAKERFSWAGSILAKTLPAGLLTPQKIAFFFRTTSPLYNSIHSKRIQLAYYNLQDPIENHIAALNRQRPTILVAPPSMLRKIAEKMEQGTLKISPIKVISIAEVLDPLDCSFLESVFKQRIHQIYQATEGFLGTTCRYGALHLNEDLLVVQKERIPGSEDRFYPVITDFNRFSQPIIRYRLNDILYEESEPCACGSLFTRIKFIEGRCDDIFVFKSSRGLINVFPDYIRRAIVMASSDIEEYSVSQTSFDEVVISVKTKCVDAFKVHTSITKELHSLFKDLELLPPKIRFTAYVMPENHVKLRRIKRLFTLSC